jgi:hypothetical protein
MVAMPKKHRNWFRDRGLVLPDDLEWEDWAAAGEELARIDSSQQWRWGDWLVYGDHCWGEMYEETARISGLGYDALRDYKWVSSRYEFAVRTANLSWSHYRVAASLDDIDARLELLRQAEQEGWPVVRLCEEVRRAKAADEPVIPVYTVDRPPQPVAVVRLYAVDEPPQASRPEPLSGAALLDLEEKHNLDEAIELFSRLADLATRVDDVEQLTVRLSDERPAALPQVQAALRFALRIKVILDRQGRGDGPGLRSLP